MNEKSYMTGFVFALLLALLTGIKLRMHNKKKNPCPYDERQEAIRGKGFKYAYFTALAVLIAGGVIETLAGKSWCGIFTFSTLVLWASICVFTTYCVIRDAYFTLRAKRGLLIVIFLAAGVINLYFGIESIIAGEIFEGGVLSLSAANLITGAGCLYLGVMMICRSIYERSQAVEE